jgi:hypothetical protein
MKETIFFYLRLPWMMAEPAFLLLGRLKKLINVQCIGLKMHLAPKGPPIICLTAIQGESAGQPVLWSYLVNSRH